MSAAAWGLLLVGLAACNRSEEAANVTPAEAVKNENPPATATEARVEGRLPGDRTSVAEPKAAIDPKSADAAGQVVRQYAELMEHGHFAEAAKLWSDEHAATAFAKQLHPELHVKIDKLGQTEGAAGSIYMTVPVTFFGDTYSKPANVVLRRVNDVPGSTDEQRRWHIERIDWD
jgi:hypothetical protein